METEAPEKTVIDIHEITNTTRLAHQNQSRLIVLADQKANALIGVLAVVFTILFTNARQLLELPLIAQLACFGFLLLELVGIAFALLVIFPKNIVIKGCGKPEDLSNPLFFGAFTHFEEQEFVPYLFEQLESGATARRLLLTDFYQVGKVLKHKYILLRRAYLVAVCGFALLLLGLLISIIIAAVSGS